MRTLVGPVLRGERHFEWRGGDVSRVEALSDAVFAFALRGIGDTRRVRRFPVENDECPRFTPGTTRRPS
jgi:hypothetical protein